MTVAVLLGIILGLGMTGVFVGIRASPVSLEAVSAALSQPAVSRRSGHGQVDMTRWDRVGRSVGEWIGSRPFVVGPRWTVFQQSLAITSTPLDRVVSQGLVLGGAALLVPSVMWIGLAVVGVDIPAGLVLVSTGLLVPISALYPLIDQLRTAKARRRHFRAVVGSFVDLVVLELAGGTGIEGALFSASQVSPDWAAQRIATALLTARESGASSWAALARLGQEIGVGELTELSTTLQLAGTEGARVRQSLQARSASLRRHEQAEEESAANATTERLFLPGALLLVGFLCFVGYPAFTRIVGVA